MDFANKSFSFLYEISFYKYQKKFYSGENSWLRVIFENYIYIFFENFFFQTLRGETGVKSHRL